MPVLIKHFMSLERSLRVRRAFRQESTTLSLRRVLTSHTATLGIYAMLKIKNV